MLLQQIRVGQALHGLASYLDAPVIKNHLIVSKDSQHGSPNIKQPSDFHLRQNTSNRDKHKWKVSNAKKEEDQEQLNEKDKTDLNHSNRKVGKYAIQHKTNI